MHPPDIDKHDELLFLCAYPPNPRALKRAEADLRRLGKRIEALVRSGELDPVLDQEVSGIAGTWIESIYSYDLVRWLLARFPENVDIDWEEIDPDSERAAAVLPLVVPFLGEEASVDANVPYHRWLAAARGQARGGTLAWLVRQFEQLAVPSHLRAALFDALALWVRWKLGRSPVTRTAMRRPPRAIFYQTTPILARRDVSIARELAGAPLPVTTLSRSEGEKVLDMARAALATRYREIYCFNYGDPSTVVSADAGRGLEIILIGIVPERRLPLRAGFAPLLLRNGVPVGYGDAFALGERMEVSLNIFYAFRSGESAYALARLLKLYHQLFGSTTFSIDPYQVGLENEEAIESGAFWFYRKLGFRCTDPRIERMAAREEARMAKDPTHRTSARTLRRMAQGSLVWDEHPAREWDRFHVRNIGLAVQKRFARGGESAAEFADASMKRVAAALSVDPGPLRALPTLAPVLATIPDLARWTAAERAGVVEIIRAKAGRGEGRYVRLLARHEQLRRALIGLGSE